MLAICGLILCSPTSTDASTMPVLQIELGADYQAILEGQWNLQELLCQEVFQNTQQEYIVQVLDAPQNVYKGQGKVVQLLEDIKGWHGMVNIGGLHHVTK